MIKVIVNITKAIVAIVVSLFFSSCDFMGIKGSGNVTTENRTVTGDFTTVNVDDGMEVIIEQGPQSSITVEADDNLQKHIKTEVKNGELYISSDQNISNGAKRITVRLTDIKSISCDGGSSIKSSGLLKGNSIDLSSDGGSSVEVRVEAKNLNCDSSGGSSLAIVGMAHNIEADASSGSSIEANKLTAHNVKADASSGSSITVNPIDKLTADASSGSTIYYVGTPSKMEKNSDSGGNIVQK
ncbi:head GIN domain-containing protein [Flavobacterium cerinum]|uniref:DUF2807 domain-containing protein n=1 Tax=Flavobacterium cerinum TaxID=2502784 RepID=A0A3S3QAC6_9FLAO|nr:head GIN domain-containing protein [Flavobacterium cerinum]RWX02506.1 DUF2807 domain-containing protein [Flavobacterium cerinum]